MTSEVVLMNRRAVALAADSATTASRWVRGERKTRYFKGANKLFHLSISDPVGLMINGSGNLQGVPWDVLIKSFRDHLGQTSYPHLKDYGKKFFEWLEKNTDAFPMEFLAKQFVAEALSCAYGIAYPGFRAVKDADGADREKKKEILSSEFESEAQSVSAAQLLANAKKKDVESAIKELGEAVGKELEKHRVTAGLCGVVGTEKLANVAIEAVFKAGHSSLDDTGIIVTGFGNKEYFASVESYDCYGNVLGKLIYGRDEYNCKHISQENTSEIRAFAKAEMIHTFMFGANIGSLMKIDALNVKALDDLQAALVENGLLKGDVSLDDLKGTIHQDFKENVTDYFRTEHIGDLRSVIGMLPLEELAELAETLVLIESLKERVTTDEESVSGPIDVAVISKNDGFIWIKRKHYFNPDLNPRYFAGLRETMRSNDA